MSTFLDGAPNEIKFYDYADSTKNVMFDLSNISTGSLQTWKAPTTGGSAFVLLALTEGNSGDLLVSAGGAGNPPIFDTKSNQGIADLNATSTWTATQNFKDTQVTGGISSAPPGAGRIAKWDLTGQTADLASANITNGTATGLYRVEYVLADTTADITAGAVTLTISWTDDVGATTATANQLLTGTGRTSGDVVLYLASGNITFATTHTGIYGSAAYALRLRCAYLG